MSCACPDAAPLADEQIQNACFRRDLAAVTRQTRGAAVALPDQFAAAAVAAAAAAERLATAAAAVAAVRLATVALYSLHFLQIWTSATVCLVACPILLLPSRSRVSVS